MKPLLCFAAGFWSCALAAGVVEVPAEKLEDQIRGGLLGHILGDLNGLRHEMKYIAEPGNVEQYVPGLPEGAWTDDDTDVEWVYLLEIERSRRLLLEPGRIAELWKRHINRRIWCSHLYLRQLLDIGILPPLTGSVHLNPWAEFNLSGQFVSESWGLISPGMPQTASRIATHYTHVSVDGEPVQATQMFASMIAAAFFRPEIERIVEAGVAAVDRSSRMWQVVADVRQWHRQNPRDWRATRRLLRDKYAIHGGNDMRDRNGVILNGASTVAALLYGQGDFVETARHAFNFGWDADNNAATAGAIIGVIRGNRWMMSQGWTIKDVFRNTSRDQMPEDETITKFGDRLVSVAENVISSKGGTRLTLGGRTIYRIRTEEARNIEPLADPRRQLEQLKKRLRSEIEADLAGTEPVRLARAAYLAICLDLAPQLKSKHAGQWKKAVEALSAQAGLMRVLFQDSPIPAGERIRRKALEAGVQPPVASRPRVN